MVLNNILAAPAFETWREGQPLDIASMLYTEDGRPRHSIFYLAHLPDTERMFFVTLLLSAVETWMRTQSGATSLRALLYMDEIYGYFPPQCKPALQAATAAHVQTGVVPLVWACCLLPKTRWTLITRRFPMRAPGSLENFKLNRIKTDCSMALKAQLVASQRVMFDKLISSLGKACISFCITCMQNNLSFFRPAGQ